MSKNEEYIMKILLNAKIPFEREKTFTDLRKGKYRFDFFIPNIFGAPVIIEIDGEQHFQQVSRFQRTKQDFLKQQEHDRLKNSYCLSHNIPLYRIPYWEIKNIKTIYDLFNESFRVKTKWHNDILMHERR